MTEDTQVKEEITEIKLNPLLEKLKRKLPGETFRLPSRGLFYRDGELDSEVENGEVTVHPMTTYDELVMRSPDMLFQGTAITTVISRCVPQVLKASRLIASDVDFLLTCIRKVSYGPKLPIKHRCSKVECDAPEQEVYLVISEFINRTKEITGEQFENLNITIDEYLIKLRPCVFSEMLTILQKSQQGLETAEQISSWIDTSLSAVIRSVDNVKDKTVIIEWLEKLPRATKDLITSEIERVNEWGVEFDYEITCEKCGTVDNVKTSLNPTNFFTLPSS
jgi:hypothetical protein